MATYANATGRARAPHAPPGPSAPVQAGSPAAHGRYAQTGGAGHDFGRIAVYSPSPRSGAGVVQRFKFKNDADEEASIPPHMVVRELHRRMITAYGNDTRPLPEVKNEPLKLGQHVSPPERAFDSADDAWNVVRELHGSGAPSSLALKPSGGHAPSLISRTTFPNAGDGTGPSARDYVVHKAGKMAKDSEDLAYKDIGSRILSLSGRTDSKSAEPDKVVDVLRDHIRHMKGDPKKKMEGRDGDYLSRVSLNNAIMFAAEGRRDVGMFPFSFMELRNAKKKIQGGADAEEVIKSSFGVREKKVAKDKKKDAKAEKKIKEVDTRMHPSAFKGSKGGEEDVQTAMLKQGEALGGLGVPPLPHTGDGKTVSDRMNVSVNTFFEHVNPAKLKSLASSGFDAKDQQAGARAAADLIHQKFLRYIKPMGLVALKPSEEPSPVQSTVHDPSPDLSDGDPVGKPMAVEPTPPPPTVHDPSAGLADHASGTGSVVAVPTPASRKNKTPPGDEGGDSGPVLKKMKLDSDPSTPLVLPAKSPVVASTPSSRRVTTTPPARTGGGKARPKSMLDYFKKKPDT